MEPNQATTALRPADELAGTLQRTEVQRASSSIPGREIVQVLTEIPVGVESGWHVHPGEEVGYILAGTVEMRIRDSRSLLLRGGAVRGRSGVARRPGWGGGLHPPRHRRDEDPGLRDPPAARR